MKPAAGTFWMILALESLVFAAGPIVSMNGTITIPIPTQKIDGTAVAYLDIREFRLYFRQDREVVQPDNPVLPVIGGHTYEVTYTYAIPTPPAAPALMPTSLSLKLNGTAAKPLNLRNGQWYLRVVAVDRGGNESEPSDEVAFYVLGIPIGKPGGITVTK